MKKRVELSGAGTAGKLCHSAALDSPAYRLFPNLLQHLAITRFDDGSPRFPGTIIVRCEGSSWKAIAKEPSSALMLVTVGPTIDDALAGLELLLGAEEAPWEPDPNAWKPRSSGKKNS